MIFKVIAIVILLLGTTFYASYSTAANIMENYREEIVYENVEIKDNRSDQEKELDKFLTRANCPPDWSQPKYNENTAYSKTIKKYIKEDEYKGQCYVDNG